MNLSLTDVERIARLARLAISPAEAEKMQKELSHILDFVAALSAVDTTGVEPMAHAIDLTQRLREDRVTEPDRRDAFLALAPEAEAGLYLVPKVIE